MPLSPPHTSNKFLQFKGHKMCDYYTGSVYIGVVGSETDYGTCRDSIHNITRRAGDGLPVFIRATKGFEGRQMHVDRFLESDHDFILFLDSDMVFEPDTLERLRGHGRPYVSGIYMRRRFAPIVPIWFEYSDTFPYPPYVDIPEKGRLHKIGASGWGCVLVHRKVFEAVKPLLKGEDFIIEDDMDIWPYDLQTVFTALNAGDIETLRKELRPLRAVKDNVGSDLRFPFFANQAGFPLYGDPDVSPGHALIYPLTMDDYANTPASIRQEVSEGMTPLFLEEQNKLSNAIMSLQPLNVKNVSYYKV